MRCEFRQGVLQQDLWARCSVSNPVPGVSISMVPLPPLQQTCFIMMPSVYIVK